MTFARFVTFAVLKILDNLVYIADISKISNTVQRNLPFFKMFFQNLAFILPSFQ